MKKTVLSFLIAAGIFLPNYLWGTKLAVQKRTTKHHKVSQKIHPAEEYFYQNGFTKSQFRSSNKVLILLLEFVADSVSLSTGNGKFIQDPADYPITLGRPPHDHQYFEQIAEALYHYYDAVSYGSLQLDIDVFPYSERGDFQAYQLPKKMGYYNPGMDDYDLMIERFEEYFQDAFAEADKDEDIDFSQYAHFMFIHAGSDWQHDILGDSPHDIPSFFIQVGDGKEAIVDGNVVIDHACNVPETITQDIDIDDTGIYTEIYNYGVINSVLVHEFGHSLGFVDLYNTYNFSPEVGYYDIMDSGGSGILSFAYDEDNDGNYDTYYNIEGSFPAFPSVWSRLIPFEDYYRQAGILKDIDELQFGKEITLLPAENKLDSRTLTDSSTYFVKIPLNEKEYVLLENRQVDPDGDGGTYIWTSPDTTVILHPTYPPDNPDCSNNYEYDFLLPGWVDDEYNSYGGGILAWHIDEEIMFSNDNFANNSINIYHSNRAVQIIEADNIQDIGNASSMFWKGTAYEPYYKFMPKIDEDGFFTGWDDDYILNNNGEMEFIGTYHNNELSAHSSPVLATKAGDPSIFSIYDISSCPIELNHERSMSLKFGLNIFDNSEIIAEFDSIKTIGKFGISYTFQTIPVQSDSAITFFSKMENSWQNYFGVSQAFAFAPDQPVVSFDQDQDGNDEYYFSQNDKLWQITPESISEEMELDAPLSDTPLFLPEFEKLILATSEYLAINSERFDSIKNAKLAFDGFHVIASTRESIFLIDPQVPNEFDRVTIPEFSSSYYPVCYKDIDPVHNAVFIQNEQGDIFKIQAGKADKIFSLYPYTTSLPSQLAISRFGGTDQVYLVFGAGDRVFVITLNGSLKSGFPAYLENRQIREKAFSKILYLNETYVALLPENNGGYIALDENAEYRIEYSFYWQQAGLLDQFCWDENENSLDYIFADSEMNLYAGQLNNIFSDPIEWSGYRHNYFACYEGNISEQIGQLDLFHAFAYPNPSKTGEVRFRIQNASSKIKLKIFDIAGNLLQTIELEKEYSNEQDHRLNTRNFASGVYFAIVESGNKKEKIKFSVIQ